MKDPVIERCMRQALSEESEVMEGRKALLSDCIDHIETLDQVPKCISGIVQGIPKQVHEVFNAEAGKCFHGHDEDDDED